MLGMVTTGTADWVIPTITGGIGVLGVLVGALIGGLIERWHVRDRENRALCITARLLYDELTTNRASVLAMLDLKEGIALRVDIWANRRADFAVPEVDIDDYKTLTVAYVLIEHVNEVLEESSAEVAFDLLDENFQERLNSAIEITARHAGDV